MLDGVLWERVTLTRLTSETGSGFLPTPVKYDSHGTWESNNYHGLGWQAKHGDRGFRPAGEYEKGYAPGRMYPTPLAADGRRATDAGVNIQRGIDDGTVQNNLRRAIRRDEMVAAGEYAEDPFPVLTDGVTANSDGVLARRPLYPTPMTRGMDGGSNSRKAFAARDPNGAAELRVSYPTPTAQDSDKRRSKRPPPSVRFTKTGLPEADRPSGSGAQLTLNQAAHIAGNRRMYPTPMTGGMESGGGSSSQLKYPLIEALVEDAEKRERAVLPTPNSSNGLRGGSHGASAEHRPGKWQSPGHPEYGELNPEWVEWIMGWVVGWTSLEPIAEHAVANWMSQNLADANGKGQWWKDDPSDAPGSGITKTVKAGDKEQEAVREARIAALGNGQVSAVVAAVWTQLWNMEMPAGEGE
ncbi:hypothetical protein D3C87_1071630 [compost metagenome]